MIKGALKIGAAISAILGIGGGVVYAAQPDSETDYTSSSSVVSTSHNITGGAVFSSSTSTISDSSSTSTEEIKETFYTSAAEVCEQDRTVYGIGCVTGELKDYGINTRIYVLGADKSQPLMMSDKINDAIYVYLYQSKGEFYNTITLSNSKTIDFKTNEYEESFHDYNLKLLSYNKTGTLAKYQVVGLKALNDPVRRYALNKVVTKDKKGVMDGALEYILQPSIDDPTATVTQINKMDYIRVTNKKVAFGVQRIGDSDYYNQLHYVSFNLNKDLEKIVKIELQYDVKSYTCRTTIKDTILDSMEDNFTQGFEGKSSCLYYEDLGTEHLQPTIEPESKKITTNGAWGQKRTYTWNTIDLTENNKYLNDYIKENYKYFVNFHNNKLWAPREYKAAATRYYDIRSVNFPAVEIANLNFIQFWYEEEGAVKRALAVDTYTTTSGNIPIGGENTNLYTDFSSWFNKILHDNMPLIATIAVIAAVILVIFLFIKFSGYARQRRQQKQQEQQRQAIYELQQMQLAREEAQLQKELMQSSKRSKKK